jgi:polysaccharide biosynthesis/export protein
MKAKFQSERRIAAIRFLPRIAREAVSVMLTAAAVISLNACVPPGGVYSTAPSDAGSATAQPAVTSTRAYEIGPEDVLSISVWKEPGLQRDVKVRPDGGISFPLAGDIHVAGKTAEQVTKIITERVQKYIPAAVVTVSVTEVAGYNIFVIGQVNEPGKFTLGSYVDVVQALTLAGGLTPFADSNAITIRRREGDREIVLPFDYGEVTDGDENGENVVLQSGDVVVVP